MHNVFVVILYMICAILDHRLVDTKLITGHLTSSNNWEFLARFCFLSEKGRFEYDLTFEGTNPQLNLLLYYDTKSQWPSVYPSTKTCKQREAVLRKDFGQIITLNPEISRLELSGCNWTSPDKNVTRCISHREFRSSRPRWWFIAVSDCNSPTGLDFSYRISLTNGQPGEFFRRQFSADEFYILPELIAGSIVYIFLIIYSIYSAFELQARKLLHVTYKLYILSLVTQLIGLTLEMHSYVYLALRGWEVKSTSLLGNVFEAFSEITFTTLLLLLSLGYTVTKSVLTQGELYRLVYFISCMTALEVLLFIYQSAAFDPGLVLYIYESPPGYGLLTLKVWTWFIFVVCCCKTSKKFMVKFRFYGSLLSLGSGWFLCQPITVLVMTILVDRWVRESVVKGGNLWVIFVGHITFLYVTRPAAANINFPFHIRTNQIVPISGEGQSHGYEPEHQVDLDMTTQINHNLPRPIGFIPTISQNEAYAPARS